MPVLLRSKSGKVYGRMGRVHKKRAAWKRLLGYFGIEHGKDRKLLLLFLLTLVLAILIIYWLISEMSAYK